MNKDIMDLVIGGVKWELQDNNAYASVKAALPANNPTEKNINTNTVINRSGIVQPSEPINYAAEGQNSISSANNATNWSELCNAIENTNHPLKQLGGKTVMPYCGTSASVMIITDVPSIDDDESGKILSGPAGELLDKMLGALGLSRDNVAICPLVFWRSDGNRTPTRAEMDLTAPFVNKAIELMSPMAILTLGALAANAIAGIKLPDQLGNIVKSLSNEIPTIPIFHPNYLLLKPDAKKPVWEALKKLLQIIEKQ